MLQANLTTCSNCQSILDVLCSIDSKLASIADTHYKNIVFELNRKYSRNDVKTLIMYKRILTKKLFNPSYSNYNSSTLISRVKVLINA